MSHPYRHQPDRAFWNRSISNRPWSEIELEAGPHRIVRTTTKIATAGSCFAANLVRWMPTLGLRPFVTEVPPPYFTEDEAVRHGYRTFGARYGNVYTVGQLRQLVDEALGLRPMLQELQEVEGRVYDLLRPHVRPGGFVNLEEARLDRAYHLTCVERLLRECEVFVFTLGLTEAWVHADSGVVYPTCPGTAAGTFEPACHQPVNFSYEETLRDLRGVIDSVERVNPQLEWILTVSPVPLVATHTEQNVLVATTFSKSVLRAACGAVEALHPRVTYFPSYEIISAVQSFGQYLGPDLRDISERGIAHVMRAFERTFVDRADSAGVDTVAVREAGPGTSALAAVLDAECDELLNDVAPRP